MHTTKVLEMLCTVHTTEVLEMLCTVHTTKVLEMLCTVHTTEVVCMYTVKPVLSDHTWDKKVVFERGGLLIEGIVKPQLGHDQVGGGL